MGRKSVAPSLMPEAESTRSWHRTIGLNIAGFLDFDLDSDNRPHLRLQHHLVSNVTCYIHTIE
jgi:hypothetical protein